MSFKVGCPRPPDVCFAQALTWTLPAQRHKHHSHSCHWSLLLHKESILTCLKGENRPSSYRVLLKQHVWWVSGIGVGWGRVRSSSTDVPLGSGCSHLWLLGSIDSHRIISKINSVAKTELVTGALTTLHSVLKTEPMLIYNSNTAHMIRHSIFVTQRFVNSGKTDRTNAAEAEISSVLGP